MPSTAASASSQRARGARVALPVPQAAHLDERRGQQPLHPGARAIARERAPAGGVGRLEERGRLAQTVKELMAAAVEEKGFRPGMVSVVQTFGEGAKFHPHIQALCSRGGRTASGEWIPLPYVDEAAAEKLFRHKVLALLRRGLLSHERIESSRALRAVRLGLRRLLS
jgi:hypothetical protein